jgi:dTDP-4-dehydrorhamnose reductase
VFNTPTYVVNLAEMIWAAIRGPAYGLFHTAGSERVTRLDLFTAYAALFDRDPRLLVPARHLGRALPEWDTSLCCHKAERELGVPSDSVRQGLLRWRD